MLSTTPVDAPLASPDELKTLLQQRYPDSFEEGRAMITPAQTLPTPAGPLTLPARWEMRGVTLSQSLAASYVEGTLLVQTELQRANVAASLNRTACKNCRRSFATGRVERNLR